MPERCQARAKGDVGGSRDVYERCDFRNRICRIDHGRVLGLPGAQRSTAWMSIRAKIQALERGDMPFFEPHLDEVTADARPNLSLTTEYARAIPNAHVIFIAVGTPPGVGGAPDLSYLQAAARGVGENLGDHFTVIINKSTVPIGSGGSFGGFAGPGRVRDGARVSTRRQLCRRLESGVPTRRLGLLVDSALSGPRRR